MAAYDQVNGVTWSHADVADTMRFNISQITGIALAGAAAGKIGSGNLSEVQLVNGDQFRGNLAGATDAHFLFGTSHAGRMQLRRNAVRKIAPLPKGLKTLYQGPENDDGWTHGKINNEFLLNESQVW